MNGLWVGSIYFIQMAMMYLNQQEVDSLSYDYAKLFVDLGDKLLYLTLGHVWIALIWKAQ